MAETLDIEFTKESRTPCAIENIPELERPRERCLLAGPQYLSLRECLALILGSGPRGMGCLGLAAQILKRPGEGLSPSDEERAFFTAMEVCGAAYLKEFSGLGPAGQAKLLAAFDLGRRYSLIRGHPKLTCTESTSLPHLSRQALQKISTHDRGEPQEWFGFIPIYRSGQLGELCLVERGVRTHVNIDPAELFARVLVLRPQGIVLVHNHPSGNVTPSTQDLDLTQKVDEIANEFGIQLLGHWVVSSQDEYWIQGNRSIASLTQR